MPKRDINQTAFDVVRQATGEAEKLPETAKAISGRKGGIKGGKARMDALTPEQRSKLAQQAAEARWNQTAPPVKTGAGKAKPRSVKQR